MNKFLIINVVVFILISCVYYHVGYQQGEIDTLNKIHKLVSSDEVFIERK